VANRRRPTRGRTNWLSLAFGALAIVLAAAAIYLALRDKNAAQPPTPPPPAPGQNKFIHVDQALQHQGLKVAFLQEGIPAGALTVPGQGLTVDGVPLYVFVYADATTAKEDAAALDPATLVPAESSSGTPFPSGPVHVASHSNIIVAVVGGPDDVVKKVDQAIQGLA
jgi:hypothetical protein